MSGFNELCPRCGKTEIKENEGLFRCSICEQILLDPATKQRIRNKESEENNDTDQTFAAPYNYMRSLVIAPGIPHDLPVIDAMKQSVLSYIRENFKPRDTDIWVATYPKCGTTWVQNVLSHIVYQESSAGKQEGVAVGTTRHENIMWMEALSGIHKKEEIIEQVNNEPETRIRCFKSHSPISLLEPLVTSKGKVIHVARNPKDVAVSMWHHSRSKKLFKYDGPFDHFLEKMYMTGDVESGSWWEFVIPYIKATERYNEYSLKDPNTPVTSIKTVWYEDLLQNPEKLIKEIAEFVNHPITEERAREICEACSFNNMREAEAKNGLNLSGGKVVSEGEKGNRFNVSSSHIRQGGAGGWKEYFTVGQNERFNRFNQKQCEDFGFKYPFDE